MNQSWKDFLIADQARFINETSTKFPPCADTDHNHAYALAHFAVLKVSGKDAAQFLQGQITCNINDINDYKASFGAFCNAKGRAITTFLLVKLKDAFALIIPAELLVYVLKKLQMYILRADVRLTDCSDDYCLIGLTVPNACAEIDFPSHDLEIISTDSWLVKLPSATHRYLLIADSKTAVEQWSRLTGELKFQPQNSDQWRYLDILAGIPWLATATSEEFIPQMLNLDKLGGISFNKGCYTGQEIIARTHYLGKSKRELYLAESDAAVAPEPNSSIIDQKGQPVGKVLQAAMEATHCKMLVVLPTEYSSSKDLTLDNPVNSVVRIITNN